MKPGDHLDIQDDGTRLARWRGDVDAWAQANLVGKLVSDETDASLRVFAELRLRQLGIAADLEVEPLEGGAVPRLHVSLQDAWKVQRTRIWPMRPFLPMKRYNEDPSVGKIYGTLVEGLGPRVFLVQVFQMGGIPREVLERGVPLPPAGPKIPTMTYDSVAQMLGDGWLVD